MLDSNTPYAKPPTDGGGGTSTKSETGDHQGGGCAQPRMSYAQQSAVIRYRVTTGREAAQQTKEYNDLDSIPLYNFNHAGCLPEKLGRGAYGHVFRAEIWQDNSWQPIAIKQMTATDNKSLKREINALTVVNNQPYCVQHYAFFAKKSISKEGALDASIAFRLYQGTLGDKLYNAKTKQHTTQSLDSVMAQFQGLVRGLQVMREKGLVHLDLKPANVLFDGIDFVTADYDKAFYVAAISDRMLFDLLAGLYPTATIYWCAPEVMPADNLTTTLLNYHEMQSSPDKEIRPAQRCSATTTYQYLCGPSSTRQEKVDNLIKQLDHEPTFYPQANTPATRSHTSAHIKAIKELEFKIMNTNDEVTDQMKALLGSLDDSTELDSAIRAALKDRVWQLGTYALGVVLHELLCSVASNERAAPQYKMLENLRAQLTSPDRTPDVRRINLKTFEVVSISYETLIEQLEDYISLQKKGPLDFKKYNGRPFWHTGHSKIQAANELRAAICDDKDGPAFNPFWDQKLQKIYHLSQPFIEFPDMKSGSLGADDEVAATQPSQP